MLLATSKQNGFRKWSCRVMHLVVIIHFSRRPLQFGLPHLEGAPLQHAKRSAAVLPPSDTVLKTKRNEFQAARSCP